MRKSCSVKCDLSRQLFNGGAQGFSLVEVVIAMLLFSLVAVALLPLLITVTQTTVFNSELLRARTAAQKQLSQLESEYPLDDTVRYSVNTAAGPTSDCALLPTVAPVEVRIDEDLTMLISAGDCPSVYPSTVSVHLSVFNQSGKSLVDLHTSLRVTQ